MEPSYNYIDFKFKYSFLQSNYCRMLSSLKKNPEPNQELLEETSHLLDILNAKLYDIEMNNQEINKDQLKEYAENQKIIEALKPLYIMAKIALH
jgi:hypothetical protein